MDFSYFDQFQDIEIDLTSYLNNMTVSTLASSGTNYLFSNKQPVVTTIKNLFTKYDIIFDYRRNIELILNYTIKDNENIEIVSNNVYGDIQYWWIIALFNDIKNPFTDWPLASNHIKLICSNLYDNERKYSYDTYMQHLNAINDDKKQIIVPKADTLKNIIWKYRQAILNG